MTPIRTSRSNSARTAAVLVVALAIGAGSGSARAQAGADADPIEGVWDFSVVRRHCASGAVLGTQKALSMFQRGGAFANDNSTPPGSHGAMFGSWKARGGSQYAVQMVFMRMNPDGTLAGTQRVQRDMQLASDRNHISGAVAVQSLDTNGAVVALGCASETAVRVF